MTTPELSLVLPCYNEAKTLPALLARAREVIADRSIELIVVDNGSTDDTPAVLAREIARFPEGAARVVRVPVNRGYGHGLISGLREGRGRFLAFTHADLQCDPGDVVRALDHLLAQPDPAFVLVKGRRHGRPARDLILTIGMQVIATAALRTALTDINAQPKVFPRTLVDRLTAPPPDFNFDLYVLYSARLAGFEIRTIPVSFGARHHGVSRWAFSWRSRLRHIRGSIVYCVRLGFSSR